MHSKPTLPNIVVGDMADTDSGTRRDTGNLDAWAVNAAYWDKTVGEGNDMYKELVLPAIEELAALDSTANECILDLATGTGIAASKLRACTGPNSHIVAADGCLEMLEIAKSRDRAFMDREMDGSIRGIEYVHLDLMDEKQLDSFTSRFGR